MGPRFSLQTAGAWLVSSSTFGYIGAFGVYQDYYIRTFMTSQSASAISWIGSTQIGLVFMTGSVSGKLLDMGYFHWCIGIGSFIYVSRLFMLSLGHENSYYQVFLPQAIRLGIGQGLLFLPSVGIISHHFAKRRSLATGIVFTGSSCGGMMSPIILDNIIKRAGFGWGVCATGLVVLDAAASETYSLQGPFVGHSGVMNHRPYLLKVLGIFIAQLGIWFPISISTICESPVVQLTILNAASILGRTLPNFISDRIGVFNVMIPCSTIGGVLVFAMFGVKSSGALVVFAVLYDFFSGSFFSLMSPLIVSLADHMHEVGPRLGFAFTVIGISTLIGTPISGALLSDDYSVILFLAGSGRLAATRAMRAWHKALFRV
ncbi:major facilitator superfamily transporter [Ceratobasidium sp. AG-Ba]|nr:major facilitator superfamily transporter [Ceratobasidium sp. AG-Ba]